MNILKNIPNKFELQAVKSDREKPGSGAFNADVFLGEKLPVVKASRNTWVNMDNGLYEFIISKHGAEYIMDIFDAKMEDKDLGFINSISRASLEEAQIAANDFIKEHTNAKVP